MEKFLPNPLPEIITSSGNQNLSKAISRAVKKKLLRKISPKIYTSDLSTPIEKIIKQNLYQILGALFPKAVISHRSALEGGPNQDNVYEGKLIIK